MSFIEAVKSVFKKYATFSGRARRSEYWYFTLFNFVVALVLGILLGTEQNSFGNSISSLYSVAVLVPSLAVTWRRLHDVGKPGTTAIMPYVSFVVSSLVLTIGVAASSDSIIIVGAVIMIAAVVLLIRLFVLMVKDGQPDANEYGPNPKEPVGSSNTDVYTAPDREDKSYAFQRDDSPVDEIQAVVEGNDDNSKVSLWGEESGTETSTPAFPQNDMLRCPSCGAMVEQGQKFCSICGTRL